MTDGSDYKNANLEESESEESDESIWYDDKKRKMKKVYMLKPKKSVMFTLAICCK